jgi:carbohydrate-selective porin OprB
MNVTNSDGDTPCRAWFPPNACSNGSKINPDANFHDPNDQNFALEAYYKVQISDAITITPAIFWFSRPQGQYTLNYGPGTDNKGTLSTLGYLVQTTFRF